MPAKVKEKNGEHTRKAFRIQQKLRVVKGLRREGDMDQVDKVLDAPQLEPGLGFLGPVHKTCACKLADRTAETGGFTSQQWQSQSPCSVKDHNSK